MTILISNRNVYQESSWGVKGGRPARKADNLNAICEPTVYRMWQPRRLTTLWASTVCYKVSVTFSNCSIRIIFPLVLYVGGLERLVRTIEELLE
jgi:hypothetical protein